MRTELGKESWKSSIVYGPGSERIRKKKMEYFCELLKKCFGNLKEGKRE